MNSSLIYSVLNFLKDTNELYKKKTFENVKHDNRLDQATDS